MSKASIRFWRRAYKRDRTNRALRFYLIAKGKAGIFDRRMLDYYGVPIVPDKRVRRFIARGYGAGLVPTSTTGGRHAPGSLHYLKRAADMGLRRGEIGTPAGLRKLQRFQAAEYKRGGHTELIGPINGKIVLRGRRTSLAEGTALEQAHDNHVHGGY